MSVPSTTKVPIIKASQLKYDEQIHDSSFCTVFSGKFEEQTVAIKKLKCVDVNEKVMKDLFSEAEHMFHMSHPNLARLTGLCLETNNYALVLEYCSGGDLRKYVEKISNNEDKQKEFPWFIRWRLAKETALGMQYLHQQQKTHQALKAPNLLLTQDFHIKISDFGFANLKKEAQNKSKLASVSAKDTTSLQYSAPELLTAFTTKFSPPCDVFAFGVILWEIATLQVPWQDAKDGDIRQKVGKEKLRLPFPDGIPQEMVDLINKCWDHDPKKRPTFAEIVHEIEYIMSSETRTDLGKELKLLIDNKSKITDDVTRLIQMSFTTHISDPTDVAIAFMLIQSSSKRSEEETVKKLFEIMSSKPEKKDEKKEEKKEEKKDEKDETKVERKENIDFLPPHDDDDLVRRAIKYHFGSAQVFDAACTALNTMGTNGVDKDVISSKYISLIFQGMKRHISSAPSLDFAFGLLAILSIKPAGKAAIAAELDLLLEAMKQHPTIAGLQEKACGCLCNLARKEMSSNKNKAGDTTEQNVALMRQKGVVAILNDIVKTFSSGSHNVLHNAKAALSNLEDKKPKANEAKK